MLSKSIEQKFASSFYYLVVLSKMLGILIHVYDSLWNTCVISLPMAAKHLYPLASTTDKGYDIRAEQCVSLWKILRHVFVIVYG